MNNYELFTDRTMIDNFGDKLGLTTAGGTMNNFCQTPHSAWCLEGEGLDPFVSLKLCRYFDDVYDGQDFDRMRL